MVRKKQINYCCYAIRLGDYLKVGMTGNFFQRMLNHHNDSGFEPDVLLIRKVSSRSIALDVEKYSLVMLAINGFLKIHGEYFLYKHGTKKFIKNAFFRIHKKDMSKAFEVQE